MISFQKKIRRSLGVLVLLSSLMSMGMAAFILIRQEEREAKQRILDEEKNLAALGVIDFISLKQYRQFVDGLSSSIPREELNEVIHIYAPPGLLLYTNQSRKNWKISPQGLDQYVNKGFFEIHQGKREFLSKVSSYQTVDGQVLWLEVSTLRTMPWSTIESVAGLFLLAFLMLGGVAFVISYLLGRKITSPLNSMAEEIAMIDTHAIKTWTPITSDYTEFLEMKPIVQSFNRLMDRLQQTFIRNEYVGRFIAHEIQTPLTVIQGEVEMSLTDAQRANEENALKQSILEEVSKINDVMETVLKVPYGDRNSNPISIEVHQLKSLVEDIVNKQAKEDQINVRIKIPLDTSIKIHTDRHLFSLLLGNLIRNANRHTPTNSRIEISCHTTKQKAVIEVLDHGTGLPPSILEAANADDAFSIELGIGLILIKQIADLLRIKVLFENVGDGQGLKVSVFAPLAD